MHGDKHTPIKGGLLGRASGTNSSTHSHFPLPTQCFQGQNYRRGVRVRMCVCSLSSAGPAEQTPFNDPDIRYGLPHCRHQSDPSTFHTQPDRPTDRDWQTDQLWLQLLHSLPWDPVFPLYRYLDRQGAYYSLAFTNAE